MLIPMLQALYDGDKPLAAHADDFRAIHQDIELFSITPQVYHLLKDSGRWEETPLPFREQLKLRYNQSLYHNLYMKHREAEVLKAFEEAECQVIPLKGIHFAERFFGHFAARVSSDIDLFVPWGLMESSRACIEAQGFEYEILKDHHARFHREGLMIELHWTLDKQYWSDLDADRFWSSAAELAPYRYIRDLSTLHTFYFICLHSARHQMDSMRYLLDIAHLLYKHGEAIDLDQLMGQAVLDKTSRRIQAVLSIVYEQFPGLAAIKPLPFKPIQSPWEYEVVRSAKLGVKSQQYYKYKLFFRHLLFDTWKHRLHSLKRAY